MRVGQRVKSDEYAKEAVGDFALWKARVPEDGEVFWPSPWGEGRPGWHIECSAMSMKILGPSFDLHLGGEDLIFPHHEDEIAQSEGAGLQADGQRFVKYWLHGAYLLVEGRKMSKSLGNFFTIRDLLAKGFSGREIRYLLLTAHYRETFNFTLEGLQGARTALARLDECIRKVQEMALSRVPPASGPPDQPPESGPSNLLAAFVESLDDDLNISGAWGAVFEWVRDTNRRMTENAFTPSDALAALAAWQKIDMVLGIGPPREAEAPPQIVALLEAREAARKARDFNQADAIRAELKAKGWVIEDTPKGPKLKGV
jgi:cysteinyl-tRNA synthetase